MQKEVTTYFQESLEKKKGVTLYVSGQKISRYIVRIINEKVVEIRNQQISKALVLIDKINAIEMS